MKPEPRHHPAHLVVIVGAILLAGSYAAYRVARHRRNLRSPATVAPTFQPPLPGAITNLTARFQADGSLKLTWSVGANCDRILISKCWWMSGKNLQIADLSANQSAYIVEHQSAQTWDYDICVQGHSARWGFGAPQRVRPPPAPDFQPFVNAEPTTGSITH